MKLNLRTATDFRFKLQEVGEELGKKYGLIFTEEGAPKFSENEFTIKIKFINDDSVSQSDPVAAHAESDFKRNKYAYEDLELGKEFIYNSERFKFVGTNSRKRKFPYICQNLSTGKYILFSNSAQFTKSANLI